jgi:hypothetical protein
VKPPSGARAGSERARPRSGRARLRRLRGVQRQRAIGVQAHEVAPAAVGRLRQPSRQGSRSASAAQRRRQARTSER